ncbi:MAG: hypothetical protein P8O86_00795 [Actinomycetota bacterium]|nr:hypothetical protein [Actinomycetota bacterium]
MPDSISRRRFLTISAAGIAGAIATAGCGFSSSENQFSRAATKWFSDQTVVANAGPQRTVWSFRNEDGNLGDSAPEKISVEVISPSGETVQISEAVRHIDGVALPYYPVNTIFPAAGVYEFRFQTPNHGNYVGFTSPESKESSQIFWPGDSFPSLKTPTNNDSAGVSVICTRNPVCPFHEISLDASLTGPRSTLLIASTPAFCGTTWMCGPVLEILIEEINASNKEIDVIHTEVYVNPSSDDLGELAPIIKATGVIYEPFIFLINRDGRVVKRLDHIWDRRELKELLLTL